jgi:hydroxymethylglutaryl-CoA lyase
VPMEVSSLFGKVSALDPDVVIGAHLHDTRGLAIANAFAAIGAGAARLDGSTGGLGGCPFAPGATGNLALEDLVHALQPMGHLQSIDLSALIEAGRLACELVGQPPQSHLASAGPRFARR